MSLAAPAGPGRPASAAAGKMIVARYVDGRILKGTTYDFLPGKSAFHLHVDGNEKAKAETVQMADLKAVFFVKDFSGAVDRKDRYDFAATQGYGRRVWLTFQDGEEMAGFTNGYNPASQGFFLIPADADGNNARVYVLNRSIKIFRWA
ncbi:MAG TPA: hypothetical protein VFB49_03715 [Patescibacteria group bacterium]|nr:hypothetical protein [Patescibacteria group bacterium]